MAFQGCSNHGRIGIMCQYEQRGRAGLQRLANLLDKVTINAQLYQPANQSASAGAQEQPAKGKKQASQQQARSAPIPVAVMVPVLTLFLTSLGRRHPCSQRLCH